MKKVKLLMVVCFFLLIAVSSSFAARFGLEFGNPAAVAILRLNPFDFKLGYNFEGLGTDNGDAFIHFSGDYRLVEMNLIDFLNIYIGAGLYAQIQTAGEGTFTFGGRIPVGLNAYLIRGTLEFFIEAVPTITFLPGIGFGGLQGWVGFTIALPKL